MLIHEEVGDGIDSNSFRKLKGELRGWDDELCENEEDVVEVEEAKSLGGGETISGVVGESCCCCC